jgi:hypothetical protein
LPLHIRDLHLKIADDPGWIPDWFQIKSLTLKMLCSFPNQITKPMERCDFLTKIRIRLHPLHWMPLVFLFSFSGFLHAQGWSFSFTLTSSGPCGSYMPVIPTFTIPYMSSQGYCESVRQQVLAIRASAPVYDDHGNYIGECAVFYTATPCSGADIPAAGGGDFAAGSVSIDGPLQGSAFFTPHSTQELENWMNDYQTRLKSMGIALDLSGIQAARDIPLTGDAAFDAFYMNQTLAFEKREVTGTATTAPAPAPEPAPEPAPQPAAAPDAATGTVQLLTTTEEQQKRDDWMTRQGFNDLRQVGENNTLDAGGDEPAEMSWSEASLREYVGNNVAGSFMLKVTDGTMKGISDVVGKLSRGDTEGAVEQAASLDRNVAFNAAIETGKEQATSLVTGVVTGPMLGLVKGADKVASAIGTGINIWNTKHGK